ncbi:hypothetical protein ABOM_007384 [Aspergillus bombycis]|uniref:Thioesterase/thiol ester dehydrase-isomerase n=1 Tax=Aspergillus bombycis TaxID=109264 RepID=A0A1F7ZZB0_9EURO|nr:hypothetical protein ABOM_007384 [Aspergillus bombycis]OGM44767.1 hypothetical protein ABOM_007384 [Aspergillus bombycis]
MSRTPFAKFPRGFAGLSGLQIRSYSVSKVYSNRDLAPAPHTSTPSNPRWFAELQAELKRLRNGQRPPKCVQRAEQLSQYLETNWLELLAGPEGFLTEKHWKALDSHEVLWGAMDSMGTSHVNNIMYNRYVETARVQFIRNHGQNATAEEKRQWDDLPTPRSLGLILQRITTEFKFVQCTHSFLTQGLELTYASSTQPMKFPDQITVLYKLLEPPTYESTSLRMEAWILSHQHRRVAARCIDDTVIYDYTSGKRSVLKPFMVDKLQHTFELQRMCKTKYTEEASKAITAVKELKTAFQ